MKRVCALTVFVLMTAAMVTGQAGSEKNKVQLMKPALLVIDIQNACLPLMSPGDKDVAMWMINAAIELFRESGFPIIRVYHTDPQQGPAPGTKPFEFPSSVRIKPDDPKIIKNYPSAFKKTDLEKMLREKGCNTLFLCGLSAVGCVLATYHGARDLDFNVFLVKDALLSHNATYTNYVEEISETVGFEAIRVMLENSQK